MLLLHHALLPRPMAGAGDLVLVEMETAFLGTHTPSEIWRTRRDLHPQPSRRQRGALLIELRVQMVGSAGNAPVVASGLFDDTRVTAGQPGHFPKLVAGMGVTPI